MSHQWAQRAPRKAEGSSKTPNAMQAIDLTLSGDSEGDEDDDDFEDLIMQAAPCPHCNRTIAFNDGEYERHIDACNETKPGA